MSSTESFDELENKISEYVENALRDLKKEFKERLQGVQQQLEETVNTELATARERAAAAETAAVEFDEVRTAMLAEAEEAKAAAVADALAAKEEELGAILEAKEADLAAALEARDSAWREVEETRNALLAEAEVAAQEAAESAMARALYDLREAVAAIDRARSQSEILHALLGGSASYAPRRVLFLTREDGLQGWAGRGFAAAEVDFQNIHVDYADESVWSRLAAGIGGVELVGDDCAYLCNSIDASQPTSGVLIPVVLRDRLAAALYADRIDESESLHLEALQLLAYVAAQALETLPLRERASTATLRLVTEAPDEEPGLELWQFLVPDVPVEEPTTEFVEEPVRVPAEPETFEAEETLAEPEPVWEERAAEAVEAPLEPAAMMPAEETGFAVEEVTEEPIVEAEPEGAWIQPEERPIEAPVEEIEEVAVEEEVAPAPEIPVEVAPPTEVAPPPAAAGAEVAPPEDVEGPGWAFTTRQFSSDGGEDAAHEEARRLARLLVTEIKLYNEEQVEEGRRGRNIYQSLREDIDRSRQIYEERIDEAIRADTDYFRDELVRILAAGDAEVLGG